MRLIKHIYEQIEQYNKNYDEPYIYVCCQQTMQNIGTRRKLPVQKATFIGIIKNENEDTKCPNTKYLH